MRFSQPGGLRSPATPSGDAGQARVVGWPNADGWEARRRSSAPAGVVGIPQPPGLPACPGESRRPFSLPAAGRQRQPLHSLNPTTRTPHPDREPASSINKNPLLRAPVLRPFGPAAPRTLLVPALRAPLSFSHVGILSPTDCWQYSHLIPIPSPNHVLSPFIHVRSATFRPFQGLAVHRCHAWSYCARDDRLELAESAIGQTRPSWHH